MPAGKAASKVVIAWFVTTFVYCSVLTVVVSFVRQQRIDITGAQDPQSVEFVDCQRRPWIGNLKFGTKMSMFHS